MMYSLLFLILALLVAMFLTASPYKFSMCIIKTAFVINIIIFIIISYCTIPPYSYDLYIHYMWIDAIRNDNLSFDEFLFNNNISYGPPDYQYLIFFNIIRYMIVSMGDNNLLPVMCVLIEMSIISYIILDCCKKYRWNNFFVVTSILVALSFLPYMYAYSGIRNGLAASIVGLAIYLYTEHEYKIYAIVIMSIIAILIHPAVGLPVCFLFLVKYSPNIIVAPLPFCGTFILRFIGDNLMLYGNDFLYIVGSLLVYNIENDFSGIGRIFLYGNCTLLLIFFSNLLICRCCKIKILSLKLTNFFLWFILFLVSCVSFYDIFLRSLYVLAILAPCLMVVLIHLLNANNRIVKLFAYVSCFFVVVISIYIVYRSMDIFITDVSPMMR